MKREIVNAKSVTGVLSLLLALPGLANAEDYFRHPDLYPKRISMSVNKTS